MNRILMIAFLAAPLASLAAPMGTDTLKMQELMGEMQNCMRNVNLADMEAVQKRSIAMEDEVRALCKNGERDAAMSKALAFAKELKDAPELAEIRKCSDKVTGMMPETAQFSKFREDGFKNSHVCDELK